MTPLSHHCRFSIASLKALERFAEQLAGFLQPGDVVALDGPLGAGKTTLTQKLTQAIGVQEQASSPTFVLMHEYNSGPYPIVHVDLYRLGEERAHSLSEELYGVIDEGRALLLVEWAKYALFLADALTVSITIQPAPDSDAPEALMPEGRIIDVRANRPVFTMDTPA